MLYLHEHIPPQTNAIFLYFFLGIDQHLKVVCIPKIDNQFVLLQEYYRSSFFLKKVLMYISLFPVISVFFTETIFLRVQLLLPLKLIE